MAQTLLVEDLMTRSPLTVEASKSLADAKRLMKRWGVRHLPVMDEGELVGLISDRDVKLIEAHSDTRASDIALAEAMTRAPWTVAPTTPLEIAVRHMARHKLGSSVVVDNKKVVGIFTSNDGLRALAQVLAHSREPELRRPAHK
jgi:acetoin utilization protein AcuB